MSLRIISGFAASALVFLQVGCDPGIEVRQFWRIRVTHVEDGQPAVDVRVFNLRNATTRAAVARGESIDDIFGILFVTDTNGFAEIEDAEFVPCVNGPSAFAPSCDGIADEDLLTGTTQTLLVDDGSTSETLSLQLDAGNLITGETYEVEVISIGPPELLFNSNDRLE